MRPLPRRTQPKRQGLIRRPVRTRMEASAELVRLEYERDKLGRQLVELKEKFDLIDGELTKVIDRAAWLHKFLAEDNAPAAPQTVAVTVHVPIPASKPKARTRRGTKH
jgi:hypothetical protein